MTNYFGVSTSLIQLTLTASMIGLAVGQLLIGPISDKYGRKNVITFSLLVYLVSTLLIILIVNVHAMIFFRFIQGVSAAGSVVISRAVASDLYSGKELTTFFGLLMAVNGVAPIISPVFGSILLAVTDWKGIFLALALIGFVLIICNYSFKESLTLEKRYNGSLVDTYKLLLKVAKNKKFMLVVLIQSFAMAVLFGYISSSPFIMQEEYGLSSFVYSLCFALNGLAIVIGTRVSNYLKDSVTVGLTTMFVTSLLLSVVLIFKLNIIIIEILFFVLLLGFGSILPSLSGLAMNLEKENAGSASAMLGFLPFLFAGIVSPIVGLGNIYYSTSAVLVISSLIAILIYKKVDSYA